jgi:HTH-type transcriptional regulator/antitoxin HigA
MKTRTIVRTLKDPERYAPMLAIRNEKEYDVAVTAVNALADEVGDNPKDARYRFIDTLSLLIEAYDEEHYPMPEVSGIELLKFLMEQHGLKQGDLPEIGTQGVIGDLLHGRRELNVRQIRALSERFNLPADAFISKKASE